MLKKIIFVILLFALFCSKETLCDAGDNLGYPNTGLFFEIDIPYHQINGEFDGKSWYKRKNTAFKLPKVSGGIGFGLSIGYSGIINNKYGYSADLNFTRSTHQAEWEKDKSDGILYNFGINGKLHCLKNQRINPYFILGSFVSKLYLNPNSSSNNDSISNSKIIFTGVGVKIGGGVAYHLNRNLAIAFGLGYDIKTYYHLKISAVKSPFDRGTSYGEISGNGIHLTMGIKYTF